MEEVRRRFIDRSDVTNMFLILKIFQRGKKFKYTVQDGDGPDGKWDTLNPWAESKFSYDSIEEAEAAAEDAIADAEQNEYNSTVNVYNFDEETNIAWGIDADDYYVISFDGKQGPWEYMFKYDYDECYEIYKAEVEKTKEFRARK